MKTALISSLSLLCGLFMLVCIYSLNGFRNDEEKPVLQASKSTLAVKQAAHQVQETPTNSAPQATGIVNAQESLVSRLSAATPEQCLLLAEEILAQGETAEKELITALQKEMPASTRGLIANLLGRIGGDAGIQAVMHAVAQEKSNERREALIAGLTSGVSTPQAAGLLATAVTITDDPQQLAPIIDAVGRLADAVVLMEVVSLHGELEKMPQQQVFLSQMVAGMKNADLSTQLTTLTNSDTTPQDLRGAAAAALAQQQASNGQAAAAQ